MKPEEMETRLQEIAAEYEPGDESLYPDAPRLHAKDHYSLYRVWLNGGDVEKTSMILRMTFDQQEAKELAKRLGSPQDFLDDLRELMEQRLVPLGYVRQAAAVS